MVNYDKLTVFNGIWASNVYEMWYIEQA